MKRILLILFLFTGTAYGNTFGKNGGVMPDQATNVGGIGADGQFHFFLLGNDGSLNVPSTTGYTVGVTVLQNAATANGNGTAMDTTGLSTVALQTSGTFNATVNFEVTVDGTNWVGVSAFQRGGSAGVTPASITSVTGSLFQIPISGAKQFRARVSAYSSGNVTVSAVGIADGSTWGAPAIIATSSSLTDAMTNTSFTAPFVSVSGSTGQGMGAPAFAYNGASWDRLRVATIFKTFTISASSAETTIWTPTSGKKFRVLGYQLFSDTATKLTFRDNTAGTVIMLDGVAVNSRSITAPMGNGIISAAANNLLTLQATTASTINGTVYGTEE